jgi:hypothetical protein
MSGAEKTAGGGGSTPASTSGATDRAAFARAVLTAVGVGTPSQTQVDMMLAWMNAEHGAADASPQAAFNPLNTTLATTGSSNFNSFGPGGQYHVRNYSTWQEGVNATAQTLAQSNFSPIVAALKASNGNSFVQAIGSTGWGTSPQAVAQGLGAGTSYNGDVGTSTGTAGVGPQGQSADNGTAVAAQPPPPPFDPKNPVAADATLDQSVAQNYPDLAWMLDDPSIGPILRYADKYGEGPAWVQAQIQTTDWWRQHSDSARQWQTLQQTDPAQALQEMHNLAAQITEQGAQAGIQIGPDRANQLAQTAKQFDWTPEQTSQALYAEAQRLEANKGQPTMEVSMGQGGQAQTYAQQATQAARQYLVQLDPATAQDIGFKIATGQMSQAALASMFTGQAKARFKDNPDLMQAIDSGITPAQVLAPYQQTIANLLEISPDQVNFADPKYSAVLSTADSRGTNRLMTETEAQRWARSQPEWWQTQNAKDAQAQTAMQVVSDMGAARF